MSDAMLRLYVVAKSYTIGDSEKGASLVEYALLVALIALVAIVGIRALGTSTNTEFNDIANEIGGGG
jgi:pilus assembly protein Flp/PilA